MLLTKNKTVVFLSILMFIISLYIITFTIKNPYIGLSAESVGNEYKINKVFSNGWAYNSGIKNGDKIISINGNNPGEHPTLAKYGNIEQIKSIKVENNEYTKTYYIQDTLSEIELYSHLIIPLSVVVLCISLGLFLYIREEKNIASIWVFLFLFLISVCYLSASGSARDDSFSKVIFLFSLMAMPLSIILFLYHYIKNKYSLTFVKKRTLYVLTTLLFIAISTLTISLSATSIYEITLNLVLVLFLFQIFLLIFLLVKSYIKTPNQSFKVSLKILITGKMIAFFPFLFLNLIPTMLFNREIISGEFSSMFIIFVPLTYTYLLLTDQVFDIDFVFSKAKYYLSATIIFTLITGGLSIFVFKESYEISDLIRFYIMNFIFLTAFIFLTKDILNNKFRAKILSENSDYQYSIYRYINNIKNDVHVDKVLSKLIEEIRNVLSIDNVSIIYDVKDKSNVHEINYVTQADYGKIKIGSIKQDKGRFYLNVGEMIDHNIILCCDSKLNNTKLNNEEKEWLNALSLHTAIFLENTRKLEDLLGELEELKNSKNDSSWITKLVFTLSEQERLKLSKDIQDTILQETIHVYNKLENLGPIQNSNLNAEIVLIKENIQESISEIRDICNELRPPFLVDKGLIYSINELMDKFQARNNIIVNFYYGFENDIFEDLDFSLNIYRTVQELFNNAIKHADCDEINLQFIQIDNQFIIKYEDNGNGFDTKLLYQNPNQFGLLGIKERAHSYNGSFHIYSNITKGIKVEVSFSLK
ncbi:MAG: sensor histidine kinase [Bacillales bacterium]|jgi:two-component system sensor histidine kinase ComP|nr:sensor histidine kinase [Bacillales bacterium]